MFYAMSRAIKRHSSQWIVPRLVSELLSDPYLQTCDMGPSKGWGSLRSLTRLTNPVLDRKWDFPVPCSAPHFSATGIFCISYSSILYGRCMTRS